MRKIISVIIILLLVSPNLYAAPCYGTKMPGKGKIHLGLENYTIIKKHLEHSSGKLRSWQEFLLLSYGLFDWLSIDLKGGAGSIKQHPFLSDELDYPTYLGGGYGFRLKLYEQKELKLVFGFQHISIHPYSINIGPVKHKAVLDDWQFSTLVSYNLNRITPYLGVRWARADYIHWIDGQRDRVKSDGSKSVGIIFGCDIPFSKNTWINLEGQAIDCQAFAASIKHSF